MKKTNKFLSLFLAALLVLSYSVLPASAASLKTVTNLKAYNIDDDEINLSWSAVTSADGYQVYIYNEASGKWQKLANTSKTFYEADDLLSAKVYKFRVRAYDKTSSGTVYSSYANLTVATEPDEVDNVQLSAKTKSSVTLKWTPVKRATGYQVFIYSQSKGKFVRKTAVTGTSAKISGRKEGTSYKFKVRAYFKQSDGTSRYGDWSDVITVKTSGVSASAPSGSNEVISKSKAESAALAHAGLAKSQVKFFQCKLDRENGIQVYEVEFDYGGYEYEYEINALSGKIISVEKNRAD